MGHNYHLDLNVGYNTEALFLPQVYVTHTEDEDLGMPFVPAALRHEMLSIERRGRLDSDDSRYSQ